MAGRRARTGRCAQAVGEGGLGGGGPEGPEKPPHYALPAERAAEDARADPAGGVRLPLAGNVARGEWGAGLRVEGIVFRVHGLWFRFRVRLSCAATSAVSLTSDSRFRVQGLGNAHCVLDVCSPHHPVPTPARAPPPRPPPRARASQVEMYRYPSRKRGLGEKGTLYIYIIYDIYYIYIYVLYYIHIYITYIYIIYMYFICVLIYQCYTYI